MTARRLATGLVLAALLSACGGGADGGTPKKPANQSTAEEGSVSLPATPATVAADQPLVDPMSYGGGPDDSVSGATESAAITHHQIAVDGKNIAYTATAGHLITADRTTGQPNATMFYVAYTRDNPDPSKPRPVTFVYGGEPGSSVIYAMLGSFAPTRLQSSFPHDAAQPVELADNPDTMLDRTDLVFVDPVGTGYSSALAPGKNSQFWGVDPDARSMAQFVKRYLSANARTASPLFLFGQTYGAARSAIVARMLQGDGVDVSGITFVSPTLDYSGQASAVGLFPTLAAIAQYHKKTTLNPAPTDFTRFISQATAYADNTLMLSRASNDQIIDLVFMRLLLSVAPDAATTPDVALPAFLDMFLSASWRDASVASQYLGVSTALFMHAGGNPAVVTHLPQDSTQIGDFYKVLIPGKQVGIFDGRMTTTAGNNIAATIEATGNAAKITGFGPLPTGTDVVDSEIAAAGSGYTTHWNAYLSRELKYTSTSSFAMTNDVAFAKWDYAHANPTNAPMGGKYSLYSIDDLAAAMQGNPRLKVLAANGYYDSKSPFHQTTRDLAKLPGATTKIVSKVYPAGHLIYLDDASRAALKGDMAQLYDSLGAPATSTP